MRPAWLAPAPVAMDGGCGRYGPFLVWCNEGTKTCAVWVGDRCGSSKRICPYQSGTVSRQRNTELAATFQADIVSVAQRSLHLPFAGHRSRIAIIDGKLSQGTRRSPQRDKGRVAWQKEVEYIYKVMRPWHHESVFL